MATWFDVGFVKLCGIRFFERLCFGDDEHGCVMVDAVGSGHLAVSECRLNIGHAIPHRTRAIPKPYQVIPHQNLWHSTQCTIEYWLGPLGRANCPGAPLWLAPLCCLITLHCIATLPDQNTSAHCSSGNSSRTPQEDLTVTPGGFCWHWTRPIPPPSTDAPVSSTQHYTLSSCQGSGVDSNRQKLPPSIHCSSSSTHCAVQTILSPLVPYRATSIPGDVDACIRQERIYAGTNEIWLATAGYKFYFP